MNHRRLFDRYPGTRKNHERWVRTVCQECSVRCGLVAYVKNGGIVDIHGDGDHPVSRGRLCARGIAFVQGLDSPDRITCTAFRKNLQTPFETLEDWEKALDMVAEHLRKIKDQYGAESIFIGCNPETDLEFAVCATRFASLLGTPHVYYPFDVPQTLSGFPLSGFPASPCYEWENSKSLLFIEADMATTHPVAFGWALEAQQQGAKIIVADTCFTRTMSKADMALRIMPDSGNILGLALMKTALEKSDYDDMAKAHFIDGEKWRASFNKLSWEDLKNTIGLPTQRLMELSDLLQRNGPVTIVTGKKLAGLASYGIWSTLVTAMGWMGTKGSGWYPLDATTPPLNPSRGIADGKTQEVSHSHDKGSPTYAQLNELKEMCKKGHVPAKAILCSGDCLDDFFSFSKDISEEPELIAYFGSFPNSTQQRSHMVFPSVLWAEKSGLCFSNDRAIHWAEKIVEPGDGCRSGLAFWLGLAKRFGWQDAFPWIKEDGSADHQSFYQWVLDGSPVIKGCKLEQIIDANQVSDSYFWSFKDESKEDGKMEPTPAPEAIEPDAQIGDRECFPLYFQKTPFVSRSGQAGNFWPWTQKLEEEDTVQINPETARALTIENGEAILISSPDRTMEGRAWISRMVPIWMVSSPKSSGGDWVLVQKMDQTSDEALTILREFLL